MRLPIDRDVVQVVAESERTSVHQHIRCHRHLQRRDPVTLAEQANTDAIDARSMASLPDPTSLWSATSGGDHSLLDPDTLEIVGKLPASRSWFTDLALDAGEDRLLTIGADDEIRLYDLAARLQLGVDLPFDAAAAPADRFNRGLALRPDGRQAAFAVPGGIAIWDLDPDHWVTAACELASRNLTREEWEAYVGASDEYHATCPQFPVDP